MNNRNVWQFIAFAVLAGCIFLGVVIYGDRGKPAAKSAGDPLAVSKDKMQVEPAISTFAPEVPPPITRKDPRILEVKWRVIEKQAEIAPGVTYKTYWTFDGQVPGPMLRGRVGDVFRITLENDISSQHPHNIDFHFVTGTGGGAEALMTPPGGSSTIEVRALHPGFFMYHCATPDIPTHIANGMYGFVLIEPEEGLPPADKEFYIVQSEFYTENNEQGEQSLSMQRLDDEHPQYVVFNGKVGALTGENALRVFKNERVRLYVGNAGLNLVSNFHVIGAIFDKLYNQADLISPPLRGVQTTAIPAGGAAVVDFVPPVPGNYMLVDHALVRAVHKGAVGTIVVHGEYGEAEKEIFQRISGGQSGGAGGHDAHMAAPAPKEEAKVEPPPAQPGGKEVVIKILKGSARFDNNPMNDYSTYALDIAPGTKVTWVNEDDMMHALGADNGSFTSPNLNPGGKWSRVFKDKGDYPYFCLPHPWMKGKITVK